MDWLEVWFGHLAELSGESLSGVVVGDIIAHHQIIGTWYF